MFSWSICVKQIFKVACDDTGVNLMVLGNDAYHLKWRPTLHEKNDRINGLKVRDKLRQWLQDHEMYRPCKSEWATDKYMHVIEHKFNLAGNM